MVALEEEMSRISLRGSGLVVLSVGWRCDLGTGNTERGVFFLVQTAFVRTRTYGIEAV